MVKKLNLLIFISFIIFCNTKPSDITKPIITRRYKKQQTPTGDVEV